MSQNIKKYKKIVFEFSSHPPWRLLQRENLCDHLYGGLAGVVVDALGHGKGAYMYHGTILFEFNDVWFHAKLKSNRRWTR